MPARYAAVDAADLLFGRATTVRNGYAARETIACRLGEQDCGQTVKPYHACCPGNTECVSPKLNAYCCEPNTDCKPQLTRLPQCANPEHDMYDFDGFFCCEQGRKGYGNTDTDGDGCGAPDYELQKFEKWLTISVSGKAITTGSKTSTGAPSATNTKSSSTTDTSSHASSTGASDSSTTSPTSTPTASSPSTTAPSPSSTDSASTKSTPAGPIAGGVVGGILALALIAFLIWFLRRRKARSYASAAPASPSGAYQAVEGQGPEKDVPLADLGKGAAAKEGGQGGLSELPGKERGDVAAAAEMYVSGTPGTQGEAAAELYSPSVAAAAELHGVERGPGELPAWDGKGVPGELRAGERGGPVELP
ncbi:hypothetical protein VE00_07676 [Pseudogymnoascus sp. WSF 3629]|nr:hypothetical protein VE00_07676 [Pseudogymnoascus sp. WSF 3629]